MTSAKRLFRGMLISIIDDVFMDANIFKNGYCQTNDTIIFWLREKEKN